MTERDIELPEMPESTLLDREEQEYGHTDDAMQAYARAAVLADRLRASEAASYLLSDMDRGVLRMPFDLAMGGDMAQTQFYARVQSLLDRIEAQKEIQS